MEIAIVFSRHNFFCYSSLETSGLIDVEIGYGNLVQVGNMVEKITYFGLIKVKGLKNMLHNHN